MSHRNRATLFPLGIVGAAVLLLGCGRHAERTENAQSDSTASTGGTVAPPTNADPSPNAEPDVTAATLTVADVDIYQKSLIERMKEVNDMRAQEAQAKTAIDSLKAMTTVSAENADSTVGRATGVTANHVERVVKTVGEILTTMQAQGMTADIGTQMDTLHMNADARAKARTVVMAVRARSDSEITAATAGMAPAVRTALEQRRPTLDSLRTALLKTAFGGK